MRKTIAIFIGVLAFVSAGFASGAKEDPNWISIAKPFIIIWAVLLGIAILIYNWESVRRVTYPAIICVWAWLYDHHIAYSRFSKRTHRVFVYYDRSYKRLYKEVQDAFDQYTEASAES